MPYFLALDAGGTKTLCVLADEHQVLARSSGGTVKLMNVGEEAATRELRQVIAAAAATAGVELQQIARTCMGLAGISSSVVRSWADKTLRGLVSGEVLLCGDEEIAMNAAFHQGPGVLVIAGTGSHVVGRCSDGTLVTAGGWGPVVGDEGSGTWIGVEAVRAGLRALDRSVKTSLLGEVQRFWKVSTLGELIAKVNGRPRPAFAELTTVVARCAEGGDAVAQDVLLRAGSELADQVSLVLAKMLACGCSACDGKEVAFTGSVLEKIPSVLQAMREKLRDKFPDSQVLQTAVDPLEGALWRARGASLASVQGGRGDTLL